MKNVLTKLQKARMELIARDIRKGGRNEFAKYNYMELADFLIPAQQIFSSLGLAGVVSFTAEVASLTITDLDSGEQVVITSPMSTAALKGCHEVQNLGAVQTYLRRYLWVAALEIVEHDAVDSSPPVEKPKVQKAAENIASKNKDAGSVAQEAFDALSPDEQSYLREVYEQVSAADDLVVAYNKVKKTLDTEEQAAFRSLFNQEQRAILKKAAAEAEKAAKAVAKAVELAGQA